MRRYTGGNSKMAIQGAEHLIEKAREFARALDACDYQTAAQYLSPNCRYELAPHDIRLGPADILSTYRDSDEKARREFDCVKYHSEVAANESSGVVLTFFDELRRAANAHTFRCSQIVYFGEDEKIDRIAHREIAGERERLNEFRERSDVL